MNASVPTYDGWKRGRIDWIILGNWIFLPFHWTRQSEIPRNVTLKVYARQRPDVRPGCRPGDILRVGRFAGPRGRDRLSRGRIVPGGARRRPADGRSRTARPGGRRRRGMPPAGRILAPFEVGRYSGPANDGVGLPRGSWRPADDRQRPKARPSADWSSRPGDLARAWRRVVAAVTRRR